MLPTEETISKVKVSADRCIIISQVADTSKKPFNKIILFIKTSNPLLILF